MVLLAGLLLDLCRRIGQSEDVIRQPSPEPLVVFKLLEELHVVVEHGSHHALQGLVMLDPGVLPVGVLPGIAVGGVPCNLGWNFLRNEASRIVGTNTSSRPETTSPIGPNPCLRATPLPLRKWSDVPTVSFRISTRLEIGRLPYTSGVLTPNLHLVLGVGLQIDEGATS